MNVGGEGSKLVTFIEKCYQVLISHIKLSAGGLAFRAAEANDTYYTTIYWT